MTLRHGEDRTEHPEERAALAKGRERARTVRRTGSAVDDRNMPASGATDTATVRTGRLRVAAEESRNRKEGVAVVAAVRCCLHYRPHSSA